MLRPIDRAFAAGEALEQREVGDLELRRAEQVVVRQVLLQLGGGRRRFRPRQGDVRIELLAVRRQAGAHHGGFHLVPQVTQRRRFLDARPDHPHIAAAAEMADAAEAQGKAWRPHGRERGVDVLGDAAIDLADEAERDVEVLHRHPAPRQARSTAGSAGSDVFGKRDADEETHGGPTGSISDCRAGMWATGRPYTSRTPTGRGKYIHCGWRRCRRSPPATSLFHRWRGWT